jgi:tetratricopeptide (TPR) repeat protein
VTRRPSRKTRSSAPRKTAGEITPTDQATVTGLPRWPFAALLVAGAVTYANALGHGFVFDDAGSVVENTTIRSLASSVWGGPPQLPTAGRPLVNVTFALNYLAGGISPAGYHVVNLAVHLACALMLFALARRVLLLPRLRCKPGTETAFACALALLWVVHPLNSEMVNYVTQRTESMMALAFLSTIYAGVRATSSGRSARWHVASVAAAAAGMACKESMATAPIMMLLLDGTFMSGGLTTAVRRRPGYYMALFATWLVLAVLIFEGPRWHSAGFSSGVSTWNYLLNQAPLIIRYLKLVVWPVGLVLDYGEPTPQTLAAVWPAAAAVVALLAATGVAWFRAPLIGFLGTWFFVTLAPTSSLVPIATEVGAERRMYLPVIAVLSLIVLLAARALRGLAEEPIRTAAGRAMAVVACAVLAVLTTVRNREYNNAVGLWQTVVARHPSGRAHYNLGLELMAVGHRDEAIREYQIALDTSPDAHYAIGFELGADGRHEEALAHYRTFIRLKPFDVNVPRAYHQIGRSLMALGRHAEAATAFREMLARKRGDPDGIAGLAESLLRQERWNDAITVYTDFLKINPSDPAARFNLGLALSGVDRDAEARDAFAAVVQLQPGNVAAHVNLAYALANTGNYGDSVKEFRRAAELEPDPEARKGILQAIAELMGGH